MAERRRSSKRRQARHKVQGKSSQFDKRHRLNTRNPRRKKTSRAKVPLVGALAATFLGSGEDVARTANSKQ